MSTPKPVLPHLGALLSPSCALYIDLPRLLRQNASSMELVFYPDDGSPEAIDDTDGKGAFQFGDQTPLVWTCKFVQFKAVVTGLGFKPYQDDKLAFQHPLMAAAFALYGDPERMP